MCKLQSNAHKLNKVFTAAGIKCCVVAVKHLPILHHSADYIFLILHHSADYIFLLLHHSADYIFVSFGITEPILFTLNTA